VKRDRVTRKRSPYRDPYEVDEEEGRRFVDFVPYVFAGAMLLGSFAFAGHYLGQSAIAHNLADAGQMQETLYPTTAIVTKASLLPVDANFTEINLKVLKREVASTSKGDFVEEETVDPVPVLPQPPKPQQIQASPQSQTPQPLPIPQQKPSPPKLMAKKPMIVALAAPKLETTFKLPNVEKQQIIAQHRLRLAEENCLARAIYFEARSESELGQLAVAKVILNRTRDANFPKTICGVVYQGSDKRNSCQFSFACDGMPDDVRNREAWDRSKRVAQQAIAGDQSVRIMGAATYYHADYVTPKWSRTMKKLIKIGHHIFYSDT
jgi:spore germination cell wall hydrolase CwlJ-like protein